MTDGGIADAMLANAPATRGSIIFSCRKWWNRCASPARQELMCAYLESRGRNSPDSRGSRCGRHSRISAGKPPSPSTEQSEPRGRRQDEFCLRRSDGRMTELTSLTLAQARDGLKQKEFSAAELADAHLAAIEKARALNAYRAGDAGARARNGARLADARLAKGEAGPLEGIPLGDQGHVLHRGRAHHRLLAHPRQFRADLRVDGDRKPLARRRGDARQDQQRRVRHGLVERDLVLRPGGVAVAAASGSDTPSWCPAARRAVRRRRWRPGSAPARPAPIPAARSASRRRSPASSASSRPTAAARAGASSPLRPRSTRPGRSRAPCATARSCCARWRATTRRTRPALESPVPDYEAAVGSSVKGMRIGIPKEYRVDGMPAGDREAVAAGRAMAQGRRRRDRRRVAAAHQIRAAGLLHRRAGGGLVQSRALRRRALRAARARPRHHRACTRTRAPPASARRCAGAS